jgi:transcriptional regulator with XRE-family HTH domain
VKETINSRFSAFMEYMGLSKFTLSKEVGASPAAIGYIVGERQSKPSAEMLEKLAHTYPSLNLNWLVAGVGPMLLEPSAPNSAECWALLQTEQARRQQLQADYDSLLLRFQER